MKKNVIFALLIFLAIFSLQAQVPPQTQLKLEDLEKNLSLVEKPQPAPEKVKPGLESITARNSIAMLSYISSDLLEGRETATRGFQLAAEYAASLFSLWGIRPAGDAPTSGGGRGGMMAFMGGGQGPAARPAPEKTYFQEFALREVSDVSSRLSLEVRKGDLVKVRNLQPGYDFMNIRASASGSASAPVVFAGYGITESSIGWDEFKNLNVKGKIVVILTEAPGKDNPSSPFQQKKELKDKYFPAAPGGPLAMMRMGGGRFNKTDEIAKLGPAAILQVQNSETDADLYKTMSAVRRPNDERPIINKPRRMLSVPGGGDIMAPPAVPTITITRDAANAILEASGQTIDDLKKKIESTNKPASMDLPGTKLTIDTTAKTSLVRAANIIGYIEGSDPKLKDEFFVIGAHYDHLGKWEDYVYNGADDNGSGSVGVLNVAKAIAANPVKPKRTVVFALWTGEEEGLLGSRYYVLNPLFPIAKTVGYLNMDMISRPYDEQTFGRVARMFGVPGGQDLLKKIRPAEFITANFTTGTGFDDIEKSLNQYVGLDIMLRPASTQERGGGGSDHSSFAMVKVPYVYYMAAMTPDYHQTSDTVDKVSGDLIAKVSRMAYLTTFTIADK